MKPHSTEDALLTGSQRKKLDAVYRKCEYRVTIGGSALAARERVQRTREDARPHHREDHRRGTVAVGFVEPIDQVAFMVGLTEFDLDAEAGGMIGQRGGNVIKAFAAIDFGFAATEEVEVGAVEDKDHLVAICLRRRRYLSASYPIWRQTTPSKSESMASRAA